METFLFDLAFYNLFGIFFEYNINHTTKAKSGDICYAYILTANVNMSLIFEIRQPRTNIYDLNCTALKFPKHT